MTSKPTWLKKAKTDLPWKYPMRVDEGCLHGFVQLYNFNIDIDKRTSIEVRDAMKWIDEQEDVVEG